MNWVCTSEHEERCISGALKRPIQVSAHSVSMNALAQKIVFGAGKKEKYYLKIGLKEIISAER